VVYPPLTFDGIDASYRKEFVQAHAGIARPQHLDHVLGWLLDGGFALHAGPVRPVDIAGDTSSGLYRALTGAGANAPVRKLERERIDAEVLAKTSAKSTGTVVDVALTASPCSMRDAYKFAAILPSGLNPVAVQREASCPTPKTIGAVIDRLIHHAHRGPLLSVNMEEEFVRILIEALLTRRIEWTGQVSPNFDLTRLSFRFEYSQPGKADNIDVHDLLDSAVEASNGERFAYGKHAERQLTAYRPNRRASYYLQIRPHRNRDVTRAEHEHAMRSIVRELERLPGALDTFPFERYRAVEHAPTTYQTEELRDAPYDHATRLLLRLGSTRASSTSSRPGCRCGR
jgi:hypothetical protein